jgi:uncharacterized membrane protein
MAIAITSMLHLASYNPQCFPDRRPLLMWAILLTGSVLLLALIVGAPLAQSSQHGAIGGTLYHAFGYVCHQQPERSFFLAGQSLAVCARCTGIYSGFALTTLLYPVLTSWRRTDPPERKWLFLAAAPLAIDFGLGLLGVWQNTHASRFLTGALLGAAVVFYVMPAMAELSQRSARSAVPARKPFPPDPTQPQRIASAPSDYSAPF